MSKPPPIWKQGWNFVKAVAAHTKNGWKLTSEESYEARLKICEPCELRSNKRCLACGCHLPVKAGMDSSTCEHPDGDKWNGV